MSEHTSFFSATWAALAPLAYERNKHSFESQSREYLDLGLCREKTDRLGDSGASSGRGEKGGSGGSHSMSEK